MKTNMKEKWNKFVDKHHDKLVFAAGVGLTVVGGAIGWKLCKHVKLNGNVLVMHEGMKNVLLDSQQGYDRVNLFTGIADKPLGVDQLGELGEALKKCTNYTGNETFTHFIAIGEDIE